MNKYFIIENGQLREIYLSSALQLAKLQEIWGMQKLMVVTRGEYYPGLVYSLKNAEVIDSNNIARKPEYDVDLVTAVIDKAMDSDNWDFVDKECYNLRDLGLGKYECMDFKENIGSDMVMSERSSASNPDEKKPLHKNPLRRLFSKPSKGSYKLRDQTTEGEGHS